MINMQTVLNVSDNSGGVLVGCLKVFKMSSRLGASAGEPIVVSVKKCLWKKHVKRTKRIVQGQVCKALILRTVRNLKRWGTFFIHSGENAVTLLGNYNIPFATRLFGPVFREVQNKRVYGKVVSMAQIVI